MRRSCKLVEQLFSAKSFSHNNQFYWIQPASNIHNESCLEQKDCFFEIFNSFKVWRPHSKHELDLASGFRRGGG